MQNNLVHFHLPGLFEFLEFYKVFLPIFYEHREYFYEWCDIGSIYGAPADCIWGGGRVGFGTDDAEEVLELTKKYGISARLTFSNSLLREEHLKDKKCNRLCELFDNTVINGIIVYSDLLIDYIKNKYAGYYFVSSTTKVITDWDLFLEELNREDFKYVVPDFRLNKQLDKLSLLTQDQKDKVEFLCNECCDFGCSDRKACYESVSRKAIGDKATGDGPFVTRMGLWPSTATGDGPYEEHVCRHAKAGEGYRFSKAMKNPGFISVNDIVNTYMPMGFSNFKIEGRSLGSAMVLEFILHYMTKPEYQINVREEMYLDSSLDLF